ncbi:histone-lysine N-methyltransferase PRDM7-like isoform X1 [Gadus chalcogrammus]|uniref:histone-lysine N-methyltransferase PRDM7-like isoform X1 n=1 Tax=Gadus chalcogrammus TaxID=1042646 RepID=UPI0024C2DE0F|nr:histone-lysine N-methyltransferase PRDM7-like isoform X1 [Gadus chalcogrammus]
MFGTPGPPSPRAWKMMSRVESPTKSMGPLAVSPSAVTRDRPAVASTHHGTSTLSGYPPRDHHRHRQQTIDLDSSCRPTSQMSHSVEEEDFADIRAYFSTTKWNRLCMAEKKRFMQIKENHLVMSSLGLSFVAPAFMRREKPGQVRVCSPEETDSEEEQLWTSGLTDGSGLGVACRGWHPPHQHLAGARVWKPPPVRQGSLQQPSTSDAVSVQSLSGRGWSDQEVSGGPTPSHPEIDPPGGGVERGSAVQEEVSLVCDECRTFFLEECAVHGPIVFMADRPVAVREKDRAKKTLPAGFEIRDSRIPGAGLGVFYCGDGGLPIGTHFGPYEGHRTDEEGALEWILLGDLQEQTQ